MVFEEGLSFFRLETYYWLHHIFSVHPNPDELYSLVVCFPKDGSLLHEKSVVRSDSLPSGLTHTNVYIDYKFTSLHIREKQGDVALTLLYLTFRLLERVHHI